MNYLHSREQERLTGFFQSLEPLRQTLTKAPLPSAVPYFDAMRESLSAFVRCELFTRQAERWEIAGIRKDSANEYRERGMTFHEVGLQGLVKCRESLDTLDAEFKKKFAKVKMGPIDSEMLNRTRKEILSEVCDFEIKANDVARIMAAVDQGFGALAGGNWKDVMAFCRDGIAQLEKARNSGDRGTSDNIAWWKVFGIILIVGAVIAGIIICYYLGPACWTATTVTVASYWLGIITSAVAGFGGILAAGC